MLSRVTEKLRSTSVSKGQENGNGHLKREQELAFEKKDKRPLMKYELRDSFKENGIQTVSCRDLCSDPCSDDESNLPSHSDPKIISVWKKQDIDLTSDLLGSTKPFLRHCLLSTGKKDWVHDVSSIDGSLAQEYGKLSEESSKKRKKNANVNGNHEEGEINLPEGCWQTSSTSTKITFTNSSHISSSSTAYPENQSVMIFPDWLLITDVPQSSSLAGSQSPASEGKKKVVEEKVKESFERFIEADATAKWIQEALEDEKVPRVRRWVLPYKAVILLCSHKKRDVRCHIAAPLLATAFRHHAEKAGWEVDERGDDIGSHHFPTPMQSTMKSEDGLTKGLGFGYIDESEDEKENQEQILKWRKRAHLGLDENTSTPTEVPSGSETGTLGIFYCSHIGGHRWAANVIIYFPNGAGVWLGRVDPLKDAGMIFEQTLQKGIVIEEFLRAGINLRREGSELLRSGSASEIKSRGGNGGILRW